MECIRLQKLLYLPTNAPFFKPIGARYRRVSFHSQDFLVNQWRIRAIATWKSLRGTTRNVFFYFQDHWSSCWPAEIVKSLLVIAYSRRFTYSYTPTYYGIGNTLNTRVRSLPSHSLVGALFQEQRLWWNNAELKTKFKPTFWFGAYFLFPIDYFLT